LYSSFVLWALVKNQKERMCENWRHRIGLSYACKRCGQPKKGHICTAPADGVDATKTAKPTQKKKRPGSDESKTPSTKRARKDESIEVLPTDPPDANDAPTALVLSDVQALLDVVDRPEGRPPSLITPDDDGEAVALSVLSTNLNSESWGQGPITGENLFSPSQFMLSVNESAPTSMISASQLGSARLGLRFQATLSPATLSPATLNVM